MHRAVGQFLNRFLVAKQCAEPEWQTGQQRIRLPRLGQVARHGRYRLRIPLLRNPRSKVVGQQPNSVAAPEERHVPGKNLGHQCQKLRFSPRLDRIACCRIVAHAARAATDNDCRIVVEREPLRQRPRLHSVPANLRFVQAALLDEGAEFAIRSFVLRAQLKNENRFRRHRSPGRFRRFASTGLKVDNPHWAGLRIMRHRVPVGHRQSGHQRLPVPWTGVRAPAICPVRPAARRSVADESWWSGA